VPKFGRKVYHLWRYSHTSFKVKTSRSSGPLMLTHFMRHIFRTARPTNFKLGVRMEVDDPHQPRTPWPSRSKVKIARSAEPGGHTFCYLRKGEGHAIRSVCVSFGSFCLRAGLLQKYQPIPLKLGVMIGPINRKNLSGLTFRDNPVPGTYSGSFFHFPRH